MVRHPAGAPLSGGRGQGGGRGLRASPDQAGHRLPREGAGVRGTIAGISGPTVSTGLAGLKLYERVHVGRAMLTGEVVKLEQDRAVIQVYEDTRGLAVGEPVAGCGRPLMVRLGPGLLSGMYDGLQRPLERLAAESGPFIRRGGMLPPLDTGRGWRFTPLRKAGDPLDPGEALGFVEEGSFRHLVLNGGQSGRISRIAA